MYLFYDSCSGYFFNVNIIKYDKKTNLVSKNMKILHYFQVKQKSNESQSI